MKRFSAFPVVSLVVAPAVLAQSPGRDTLGLRPAFRAIDQFVGQEMQAGNTPGMALALVDRAGLITVRTYGYADLDRRIPVEPATRFQIGSISKSFTAIALLQLAEEGRFDPQAPVRRYLPWFTPTTRGRPISGHDLLTHTSGLPRDRDDIPSSPAQAYFARERTPGSPPGARWAYSNIGYQVLGKLLESIERAPYPDIIRRRILEPLGMSATDAAITHDGRPWLAVGYRTLYDDRPARAGDPLVPAEWVEYASGDGSVVGNVVDIGVYLEMLLNAGEAPTGPGDGVTRRQGDETTRRRGDRATARQDEVLSRRAYAALTRPWAATARGGDDYGYGLFLGTLDRRSVFYHGGGMLGYAGYLIGEPALGIGAVVLVNGPGSPGSVARFALRALSAAMRGDSLPEVSPRVSPTVVAQPERYAGTYRGPQGDSLVFLAAGDSLLLIRPGRRDALETYGEDAFLGPRPEFSLFPIRFATDSAGATAAWYGDRWYAGARHRGASPPAAPKAWQAFEGHYRIMQPWDPNFRIVLRRGRLWYIDPEGGEEPLTPIGPAEFRVGEEGSAERLRFADVVDGQALTAVYSGMVYYRFFVP
jgi:CubicO group peptidase (beta-lactamase class C family)